MTTVHSRNFAIATLNHNSPLRSSGDINFHTVDSGLYFLCSAGDGGCPLLALPSTNPWTHIDVACKSTKVIPPSSTIRLAPGWALASKQTAERRTAIQIQTSDCWQCLVGLQVAFICLHESSWSLFSRSYLNMHLLNIVFFLTSA